MARAKSCSFKAGAIKPCKGLDSVLQMPFGRGTRRQGVERHSMFTTKGKVEFSRHLVVIKSGEHGTKGIVANYCPFCGNDIVPDVHASLTAPDQGGTQK
jgi:hypothetical protein